jgi:hypothetical protein
MGGSKKERESQEGNLTFEPGHREESSSSSSISKSSLVLLPPGLSSLFLVPSPLYLFLSLVHRQLILNEGDSRARVLLVHKEEKEGESNEEGKEGEGKHTNSFKLPLVPLLVRELTSTERPFKAFMKFFSAPRARTWHSRVSLFFEQSNS